MEKHVERCVVVFSGGQDSTTTLLEAIENYDEIHCVTFNYGQKHSIELDKAREIVEILKERHTGVTFIHKFIDAGIINELTVNSLTRDMDIKMQDDGLPNSFVPGRNILFLTLASIYAQQLKINDVITGVNATDYSGYPDCRPEFITSMENSLRTGMDRKFRIITPLMNLTKAETWALSDRYTDGADFINKHTHTCYNGVDGGCGECPACKLRDAGLKEYNDNYFNVKASLFTKEKLGKLFTR